MSLEAALSELQARLAAQGTKTQPAEGTTDWFLLRATALGEQLLQNMKKCKTDPAACEAAYKSALKAIKWNDQS